MSFGMYLVAVFCSPLYFMLRGRWIAAIVNGGFYLLSLPLLFALGAGVIVWMFCVVHAVWDMRAVMREQEMQRQAALIAERMAHQQAR